MRRLLLIVLVLAGAAPAAAQNCVTINGVSRCSAPWQLYDTTPRSASLPVLDLTQTWASLATTFTGLKLNITDSGSATASLLMDLQVGGISKFSVSKAGAASSGATSAIGTTSTDGFTVQNTTPSTSAITVQMSPRYKACGSAYNSVSTLSETDCMWWEVLPATVAGTTTQTWKLGSIVNGGAATYPLTADSAGTIRTLGTIVIGADAQASSAGWFYWAGRAALKSPADGIISATNLAGTIGSELKTDALPTVASGFGTSPSITAGSTPLAGSVNVGTGGAATSGVINFNGTAFPSAPFCTVTPSLTNVPTRPTTVSTTQLTLTTSTAWTASDVVTWTCISSK